MTNNEYRQQNRKHVNRLKREIAAMRTAAITAEVQAITSNPAQMELLATLFVLWRRGLDGPIPGNDVKEKAANRTLIALDDTLRAFSNEMHLFRTPDTDYVKGAEVPFAPLPQGWSHGATEAQTNARWHMLPQTTWKWVFFKDGKLAAGFEDHDDACEFFSYLAERHGDACPRISACEQRTKKESATPGLFFPRKEYAHYQIMRKAGEGAFPISAMPPLTPPELEETIANRICAALNLAAEEVERYRQNAKKQNNPTHTTQD